MHPGLLRDVVRQGIARSRTGLAARLAATTAVALMTMGRQRHQRQEQGAAGVGEGLAGQSDLEP